ncbi:MAG: radical SAM protein [bacterium]
MTRRKILLLNPPGKHIYMRDYYCSHTSQARYYWGPYDLIVMSGILGADHDLIALDALVEGLSPEATLRRIEAMDIDTILFLTGAVSWEEDFKLLDTIARRHPGRYRIVGIGDILFAEAADFLARYDWLWGAIQDFTTDESVGFFKGVEEVFSSISYRNSKGEIVAATKLFPKHEFALPPPKLELFPYKKYRIPHGRRNPYAGILSDYGCAYHCTYCIGGELGFKYRSIENTLEELRYYRNLGIKELWFKDLVFGLKRKHYDELLTRMIEEKFDFTWACLSRAPVLKEDLLQLMKRAGCHTIQMGIETADEELLSHYSKGVTCDKVRTAVTLCKQVGIRVLGHFILGLPGDTEEAIHNTIKYALELDPDFASFNVAMPRMGTKFRDEALEKGLVTKDINHLDNSISYPVFETKQLSRQRLWDLRNIAVRTFYMRPQFMARRLFGVRSLYELQTLFDQGFSLMLSTLRKPVVLEDMEPSLKQSPTPAAR